jgi:hypothetical protein
MAPVPVINLERELDRLFQAPFAEFVGTRNGLASQLKKAGRAEESARVRGLAKPTYTAWLVNQLYWTARAELDAYLDAADRVRALEGALIEGKKATGHGDALAARTAALDALLAKAASRAGDEGTPLSPALAERLRTTLEAIGAFGSAAAKHQRGRLQEDLDPPGFAAFASLAAGRPAAPPSASGGSKRDASAPPLRLVSRGPGHAEARQAAEEARARLQELQTAAARSEDAARARLQEAERTLQSARAEVEATSAALKSRQADLRRTTSEAAAAQKALDRAKRTKRE